MSLRPLLHRLEHVLYRLFTGAVLRLPHRRARRIGRWVGGVSYRLAAGRRRLALANLALTMPELAPRQHRRITRACFAHYGATFLETLSAARFEPHEIGERFEVEGWEHLEAALAEERGLFILSGHYGAWDMAAFPLSPRLGTLHLLAREQKNPWVSRDIEAFRKRWGNVLLPRRGAGRKMLSVVRKGGRIALMIDQRVKPNDGILIPFLGRPAWTTPILARLSIYKRVPVVPVLCVPIAGGRYRVTISPAIAPEGRGEDAEVALTRRYLAVIEEEIRRRPELWMWMHRRWQLTQPSRTRVFRQRLERDAELPQGKSFATLDAARLPPSPRRRLRPLRRYRHAFLEAARNVAVFGGAGSGKTHLAAALGDDFVAVGYGVRFASARQLAGRLLAAEDDGDLGPALRKLDVHDLLILDAVCEVEPGAPSSMLVRLLEHRRGRRSTVVTSRLPFGGWRQIFADGTTAAAAVGCLEPSAVVLELGEMPRR